MKVLWLAVTPSGYQEASNGHNGGGWISSLETIIKTIPIIKLGVAFRHNDECFKCEIDGVVYYPISLYKTKFQKLLHRYISYRKEEIFEVNACLKIIDDFKPDIIHVFGTEWSFGLIKKYTDVPVVIHVQGLAHPYLNAYFPPEFNKLDFIFGNGFRPKRIIDQVISYEYFKYRAERELRILKCNQNYMGRTHWDESIIQLLSSRPTYYYCSEALRNTFFSKAGEWRYKSREIKVLTTTISSPLYKGIDVILKAAKLLQENTDVKFLWKVYGLVESKFIERKLKIRAKDVNVKYMGIASANSIKNELLNSDIYIHTSYIDNSPNSICEAQLLGLPIISTNVGGIASLIDNGITGLLIASNDPYLLAHNIKKIISERELSENLGANAYKIANSRHNIYKIQEDLLKIYNNIIEKDKVCN